MTLTIYWELPQKNINQHAPCSQKYALQSNFIEILLRHGCSPVNLLHIFRTAFPKNTSEGLLLNVVRSVQNSFIFYVDIFVLNIYLFKFRVACKFENIQLFIVNTIMITITLLLLLIKTRGQSKLYATHSCSILC